MSHSVVSLAKIPRLAICANYHVISIHIGVVRAEHKIHRRNIIICTHNARWSQTVDELVCTLPVLEDAQGKVHGCGGGEFRERGVHVQMSAKRVDQVYTGICRKIQTVHCSEAGTVQQLGRICSDLRQLDKYALRQTGNSPV